MGNLCFWKEKNSGVEAIVLILSPQLQERVCYETWDPRDWNCSVGNLPNKTIFSFGHQAMPNIVSERMRCFLPMSPQPAAASLRLSINIYLLLNMPPFYNIFIFCSSANKLFETPQKFVWSVARIVINVTFFILSEPGCTIWARPGRLMQKTFWWYWW